MDIKFEPAQNYKTEIEDLYISAFPKEERAPLKMLYKKAKKSNFEFSAVTDNGEFIGLTYTAQAEDIVTLMYFAVSDNMRGKGYGGRIIDEILKKHEQKKFFLVIEPVEKSAENYEQRVRRRDFYLSHGLKSMGYRVYEFGVVFEVLGYGLDTTKKNYNRLMRVILGNGFYIFAKLFRKLR